MWVKGIFRKPTRLMLGLALLRMEFEDMIEPFHVQEFRSKHLWLDWFTWVPQDSSPEAEIFVRRRYEHESSSFGFELAIWDRLDDIVYRFTLASSQFGMLSQVAQSLSRTGDARQAAYERQDRKAAASRTAVNEEGTPLHYELEGHWLQEEKAYNQHVREISSRAHAMKGGAQASETLKTMLDPDFKRKTTQYKPKPT